MLGPDLKAQENLLDKMQFYSRQFGFSLIALLDDGGRQFSLTHRHRST